MKSWSDSTVKLLSVSLIVGLMLVGGAQGWAQGKEGGLRKKLIGTWTCSSEVAKKADGSTYEPFGGNTRGVLMLDKDGYFSVVLIGDARKKFTSNSRLEGSLEENKGVAQGTLAFYGRYSVNETDHILTLHVEGSSYANWDATDQRRVITVTSNELKWTSSAASGGGTAEVIWKRTK